MLNVKDYYQVSVELESLIGNSRQGLLMVSLKPYLTYIFYIFT